MKVIDAMMKISRGEEVKFKLLEGSNIIYHLIHGCYLYDETNEEEVEWFIDENWLNREIKLIEEDKKIEKIEFNEIEDGEHYKIKRKINEIIDVLNEMREDK